MLLGCALAAWPAAAQTYQTEWLTEATDPRNRINLVVLGDGYTADADSQAKLTTAATSLLATFFATSPYQELRGAFTAKLVHVVSNQSGATNGAAGGIRDTALHASFNCGGIDRLLCVDGTATLTIAAEHFPEFTLALVIVNDTKYGGSGGQFAVTSVHPDARWVLVHETGHALGDLADEYSTATPGYGTCNPVQDCWEANATVRTARADVKWLPWIDAATPVPTPAGAGHAGVGLFEGARYQASGVYRPTETRCMMRSLQQRYCRVCSEALTTSLLGRLSLVDGRNDPGAVAGCAPISWSVAPLPIDLGAATYRWTVDGSPRPEAGPALRLDAGLLRRGAHEVAVAVEWSSTLVRRDPSGALRGAAAWSTSVEVDCEPLLVAPGPEAVPPGGSRLFSASGGAGAGYAWALAAGGSGGAIDVATGAYRAGRIGGVVDQLRVVDGLGNAATASVQVTAGVTVSPMAVTVPPRGSQAFTASGGSGAGFTWSLTTNGSGATLDAATGAYQAGPAPGASDVVQVTDSLGNADLAAVTTGPALAIGPAEASVAPGGTIAFTASGGSGAGYAWSLVTSGSGGTIDAATGAYRAGATGGVSDLVRVADPLGNAATATVAVAAGAAGKKGGGCASAGGGGLPALLALLGLGVRRRRLAGAPSRHAATQSRRAATQSRHAAIQSRR